MDPLANINEQREIAQRIIRQADCADEIDPPTNTIRLAELVLALDEWRQRGGFDPYAPAPVTP